MYKPDFEIEKHEREKTYKRIDVLIMLFAIYVAGYMTCALVHGL